MCLNLFSRESNFCPVDQRGVQCLTSTFGSAHHCFLCHSVFSNLFFLVPSIKTRIILPMSISEEAAFSHSLSNWRSQAGLRQQSRICTALVKRRAAVRKPSSVFKANHFFRLAACIRLSAQSGLHSRKTKNELRLTTSAFHPKKFSLFWYRFCSRGFPFGNCFF